MMNKRKDAELENKIKKLLKGTHYSFSSIFYGLDFIVTLKKNYGEKISVPIVIPYGIKSVDCFNEYIIDALEKWVENE